MATAAKLKIFLAGRVALESDGVVLDEARFPGRQGRLLFAYLVAEQGRPVPRDELADALWGEAPPATSDKALTVLASKLRGLLADREIDGVKALTSAFGSYRLNLPDGTWVDILAAADALREAEAALAADDLDQAKAAATLAASLSRPSFLPGEEGAWVDAKRRELGDILRRALSCLAEASLRLGDAAEAASWAEETIALEPYRESGYRQLMAAHAAAGNRAEALRVYERCRQLLATELGAYPSPETESIYRDLLRAPSLEKHGASPAVGFVSEAVPPPAKVQRKTVTVLFCDIARSTELGETTDPEALQTMLARYLELVQAIVERHGGTLQKAIADAVLAVFGVPVVHEDDALRAVRAADEMRDALPELGLTGQIAVMTGEVVTGKERLATGEVVNVAKGLLETAGPGEVLVGEPTLTLVHSAVDTEPVEPVQLKGRPEPAAAHRLLRVRSEPEMRPAGPFVGRKAEVAYLLETWDRVRPTRRCELVTVVGEAGVGKSRLATEFLASIETTVVGGRCPPYGEGITYLPVVEVLRQLDLRPAEEAAAAAIDSLLGETDAPTSADEIAWAVRKLLEQAAAERPLVVLFDDLQWGEEAFLDLIEQVALLSSDAPILLLCLARPELTDRRPAWPVALRLGTLDDEDVDELIPRRLADDVRARIARAAGGNPLFVEEILAVVGETDGETPVPPTLQALLATRLDQLESAERSVLEGAAIEGEIFHRGAVQALAPDMQVTPYLASLVRKGLVEPDRAQIRGEDGFRFHHLLIRDAAYGALPKETRAQLHQRFAAWLEHKGGDLVELDELVGYHLEQACRYRAELGAADDGFLAAAARRHLTAGGYRAGLRQDYGAAANLLERAAVLVPASEIDLALESSLFDALVQAGKGGDALRRAGSIAERASASGDLVAELCGRIKEATLRCYLEPEGATERLAALLDEAMPVFKAAEDDLALAIGFRALAMLAIARAQTRKALDAGERAAAHARQAGVSYEEWLLLLGAGARLGGTTPVPELLAWLDEQEAHTMLSHNVRGHRAQALAMLGRFDEARAILAETRAELAERGGVLWLAVMIGHACVDVELLAGDPAAAVAFGEEGFRLLEEPGEKGAQSYVAGKLAQALYMLDRLEEAEAWAGRVAELGATDDLLAKMLWQQAKAKVLARRGEHAEAQRIAREAVATGDNTDLLDAQGDAYADLGLVLLLGRKTDEAALAFEQALDHYERKGNLVMAQRVRTRLEELPVTTVL